MIETEGNLTEVHLGNGEIVKVDRQQLAERLKHAKFVARLGHHGLGEIGPIGLSLEKATVLLAACDLRFGNKV